MHQVNTGLRTNREPIAAPQLFCKQLAMGPHADQVKVIGIRLSVNQQQIGFEMTLTITVPIAAQTVVSIAFLQRFVIGEQADGPQPSILSMSRWRGVALVRLWSRLKVEDHLIVRIQIGQHGFDSVGSEEFSTLRGFHCRARLAIRYFNVKGQNLLCSHPHQQEPNRVGKG